MTTTQLQKSNTIPLLSKKEYRKLPNGGYQHVDGGPVINDPEYSKEVEDAMTEASKSFDAPLMSKEELDKI